jgi:hypothetical protein
MEKMKCLTAGTSALGFLDFKILFKKRSKFPQIPQSRILPFYYWLIKNKCLLLIYSATSHFNRQSFIISCLE